MNMSPSTAEDEEILANQDVDKVYQESSMKGLSNGFPAPRSSSSSTLCDTACNSSISSSSSSASLHHSCTLPSISLIEAQNPSTLVAKPHALSQEESNVSKLTDKVDIDSDIRRFRYRRIYPQKLLALVSSNRDEFLWEEVEDDFLILLEGRLDRLQIFRDFFFETNRQSEGRFRPRRSCDFLLSLGYLLSSKQKDLAVHDEHVSRFASFLSTGRDERFFKLAVVRTIYKMCLSTPQNATLDKENSIQSDFQSGEEKLYNFLTIRSQEWEDELVNKFSTDAVNLVYEIRAKCLRDLDLERERIKSVAETGNSTAVIIATGAKIVELGIQKSNKVMEGKISNAGEKVKVWIDEGAAENQQQKQLRQTIDDHEAIAVRAISSTTKRASEYANQSSKVVAESTVDTTLSGLNTLANRVEESTDMADQLSPESREIIRAAGKIGIASVGAVALVAEAVIETSRSLSSKTANVTADVVGHKYGSVAGEVAQDAADTYTNVLETMKNITLASNGSKLVTKAAQNVGKNQIDEDVERAKKVMLNLERQGAFVAKHALGIQWTEGSFTRELLCDVNLLEGETQKIASPLPPQKDEVN